MFKLTILLLTLSAAALAQDCSVYLPALGPANHTEAALEADLHQRLVTKLQRKHFQIVGHPANAHYVVESHGVSCDGVQRFLGETYCRRERQAYINLANSRTGALTIAQGRSRLTVRDAFDRALREIPTCRPGEISLRRN